MGTFQITVPEISDVSLLVTAPGFETKTLSLVDAAAITLNIAPQNDSVTVAGTPWTFR